jgi:hypothetical protein
MQPRGLQVTALVCAFLSVVCAQVCFAEDSGKKAERALWGQRSKGESIVSSVRTEAIQQGHLADCWFLSALALVAKEHPEKIPGMITVEADGSYTVLFPGYERPVSVTAAQMDKARKTGVRPTKYGDWPLVLECAAAKIYPESIEGGGTIDLGVVLVTGIDMSSFSFLPNRLRPPLSSRELSDSLMAAHAAHQPIMVATPEKTFIVDSHAYSVVDVTPASPGHSAKVTVRNPWGRVGFDRRNDFEIEPLEDGKFRLPISSLFKYFDEVSIPTSAVRLNAVARAPRTVRTVRAAAPGANVHRRFGHSSYHALLPLLIPLVAATLCLLFLLMANPRFRILLRAAVKRA